MAVKKAKIFTIASVKGGVGKTTTTLNLAGVYQQMGLKVLIIDLDLYGGAVAPSLNVDNTINLFNLISDFNSNRFEVFEHYITNYKENIDVLSAPNDPRFASKIGSKYLSMLFARAELKYDIILIDTNHFLNELNLVAFDYSDQILFVITNDLIDLKSMKTMVSILKDMEKVNYKIVLNEARDKHRQCFSTYDMKNIMKDNVDFTIPASFYIKGIDRFVLDGEILTLNKSVQASRKKEMKNFKMLAEALLKEAE